jgi:Recombination endonuclease VII
VTKVCGECGEEKPIEEFNRHSGRPDGRQSICSRCRMDRQREMKYGMSAEEYAERLEAQGGVCAICGNPEEIVYSKVQGKPRALAVDHDHETGENRALLCRRCNGIIGLAHDDPDYLMAMASYLLQHQPAQVDV